MTTENKMMENIKYTEKSFINRQICTRAENKFREWQKLGGFNGWHDDDVLAADECENIADQFATARENGGNYFSNIIAPPFFTQKQIRAILTLI